MKNKKVEQAAKRAALKEERKRRKGGGLASLKPKENTKEVKQTFLIVCEGEETEKQYFDSFSLTSANVKCIGKGRQHLALVD